MSGKETEREGLVGEEKTESVERGDALGLCPEGVGKGYAPPIALVEVLAVEASDDINKGLDNKRIAQQHKGVAVGQEAGSGDKAVDRERKTAAGGKGAGMFGEGIADGVLRGPLLGEEVEAVGPSHKGLAVVVARRSL